MLYLLYVDIQFLLVALIKSSINLELLENSFTTKISHASRCSQRREGLEVLFQTKRKKLQKLLCDSSDNIACQTVCPFTEDADFVSSPHCEIEIKESVLCRLQRRESHGFQRVSVQRLISYYFLFLDCNQVWKLNYTVKEIQWLLKKNPHNFI